MRHERLVFGLAITAFLGLYTALVFGLFSAEAETRQLYVFLVGLPLISILFFFPRAALIALGIIVYSVRWLYDTAQVLPREATWLGDLLILVLVGRTLLLLPKRQERLITLEKYIFVLLLFALFSALLNGANKITLLAGLRMGFRYVLLFVAAYNLNLSPRWIRNYILMLFAIGILQTPIVWTQFAQLKWHEPDRLSGTFGHGGTPAIALFLLTLFAYMAARMIEEGRVRPSYLAILAWISVSPFFGEAKMYYLFMPLLLAFMLRAEIFRRPVMSIALLCVAGTIIVGSDYLIVRSGHWYEGMNPLTFVGKIPQALQRDMEVAESGRFERGYKFVNGIHLALRSPRVFLVGEGPGAVTESYLSEQHTSKQAYYATWGISSSNTVSFIYLLIEYGYLGITLLFVLLYLIFRRARPLRASPDPDMRVYGRLLEAMVFTYTAWMFYQSAWQADPMGFIFWPLAGMLVRLSYVEEARQAEAAKAAVAAIPEPTWLGASHRTTAPTP